LKTSIPASILPQKKQVTLANPRLKVSLWLKAISKAYARVIYNMKTIVNLLGPSLSFRMPLSTEPNISPNPRKIIASRAFWFYSFLVKLSSIVLAIRGISNEAWIATVIELKITGAWNNPIRFSQASLMVALRT